MKDKVLELLVQYSIDVTGGDISPDHFEYLALEIDNMYQGGDKNYEYEVIINYLNTVCGTKFRSTVNKTRQQIRARYKEGFKTKDFLTVIDNMAYWWTGKTAVHEGRTYNMSDYLRPQTLFGTKFEKYLLMNVPRTGNAPAMVE